MCRFSGKFSVAAAFFFAVLSQVAFSQESSPASPDFSSINKNLNSLESLITDTLGSSEAQAKQLEDLKTLLSEREASIAEREKLLEDLQSQLNEMSETYAMQSALSAQYEASSRFWKKFSLIGIPAAILSGFVAGFLIFN